MILAMHEWSFPLWDSASGCECGRPLGADIGFSSNLFICSWDLAHVEALIPRQLRRTNTSPATEGDRRIADYGEGDAVRRLAHHKLGCCRDSIRNRSNSNLDPSAGKVDAPSNVLDRFEASAADGEARRPQPQRAHSTIDNNHSDTLPGLSPNRASNILGRKICVARPQHYRSLWSVLPVDPSIRDSVSVFHCEKYSFYPADDHVGFV